MAHHQQIYPATEADGRPQRPTDCRQSHYFKRHFMDYVDGFSLGGFARTLRFKSHVPPAVPEME